MMQVYRLPALSDNYIFVLVDERSQTTAVVDAGDAAVVLRFLAAQGLGLSMVLNTHYDGDHVAGNPSLLKAFPGIPVYGSAIDRGRIPGQTHFLEEGDQVNVGASIAQVLAVPGHRHGHLAYYFPESSDLFCGDVIFSGGSGRIKDCTPEQMQRSLAKLRSLPDETKIWCAHEYTLDNLRFALTIDPDNLELRSRMLEVTELRSRSQPTIPTMMGFEKRTNPFLRWDTEGIRSRLGTTGDVETYTEVRSRKNVF
jgi:hydroxyacylglutathione hydrolase